MFDEDIKIAGTHSGDDSTLDAAELAARDFLAQKKNGNVDRARSLGETFAGCLWGLAQDLIMDNEFELTQQEIHHRLLLCSYGVNRVIAQYSPNSIVAQTALSRFYAEVEEKSNVLHRHVSDTAAFSLYILSERSGHDDDGAIGKIYARFIGRENDSESVRQGGEVYRSFYSLCKSLIDEVRFAV
jgi:hypothetical protein